MKRTKQDQQSTENHLHSLTSKGDLISALLDAHRLSAVNGGGELREVERAIRCMPTDELDH